MDVHIRLTRRGDLSVQIYRQLREAILDGRFRPGERLPPTRELARRLGLSRNTVTVAYEQLAADGVLTGHVGAGSFVAADIVPRVQARRAPSGAVLPREPWRTLVPTAGHEPAPYDFSVGVPDYRLFPYGAWRRLLGSEVRALARHHGRSADPGGQPALRAAIARSVGISRAVRAGADDVIVTHGAQQAFDLLARILVEKDTNVAVEEPGYSQVRLLLQSHGARVTGVPVDEEGLVVDAIPAQARLVYVTPSHQFPLGPAMSLSRRTALLAWADRRGAVVIEDDYDSEFRFDGRPLDPLQSLDRAGRVVYVGSFSKVLLPALRVGFVVAPASLQPALRAAKHLTDWHNELATQGALARFIDEGLLTRHVRRVAREYAIRHARIVETLEDRFARWLRVVPSAAGLHVTATLKPKAGVDLDAVLRVAAAGGVRVMDLATFHAGRRKPRGLVIGYGAIAASRLDEGLERLAQAFADSQHRLST